MSAHRFHPSILREYDVRGIAGDTLTEADARALGSAFGSLVGEAGGKSVAVGYDGRLTSPALEAALVRGLQATGLAVTRVGIGPTPLLSFAIRHLPTDAGVMVTGSHNPPAYNGFKMTLAGRPFFGQAIVDMAAVAAAGRFRTGAGTVLERDIRAAYVQRLLQDFPRDCTLSAVWDPGNGAAADVLHRLCAALPGRHRVINGDIDGTFPSHHPDPTVAANMRQLQAAVLDGGADLGIAFDGDADRIGLVDGKGRILAADQMMMIYAGEVLADHPGATIIADVKSSETLFSEIARMGGRPVMWNTGHSLIKAKLAAEQAPLAGEMSGHIFFADRYYGFDDALYAGVRMLALLGRGDRSLAERRDAMPAVVNTPELRFQCDDDRKFRVIDEIRTRLARSGADFNAIDGVRVREDGGWWLIRASNTQDSLVVRCEAPDQPTLQRLIARITTQLEASGITPPDDLARARCPG